MEKEDICYCFDLSNIGTWQTVCFGRIHFLCLLSFYFTLTLFLHCLTEFRKKNAGKKAAVSKGKEDQPKKKRKLEGESSAKGNGSDKGEGSDRGEGDDDQ